MDGTRNAGQERVCAECASPYLAMRSGMAELCPECAHRLYGLPPCEHEFANGHCRRCHWNGSQSAYIRTGAELEDRGNS